MTPPRATFDGSASATPEPSAARLLWEQTERADPGALARYGITDESLDAPGKTLEQAVDAGWIEAAEMRAIQGTASKDDLIALGYTPAEVGAMLEEQQDRAGTCESSS
jgi:hypothetical protein